MDPKKSILNVLPVEITILIARHMTRSARENFSRCSVLCYQICFSLRFSPRIILTPDSISLFKDGGVCEPVRRSIRSIRFLTSPAPMSYQDLYSALSSENRAFLGKEIEEGELKEFGPKLSSLKTATIWAHRSTTLLDEDNIGIFERSRFYTASLATAPELDTLYVKNEVLRDSQDKVDACQIEQLGEQLGTKFCDEVSLIEYLGITHVRPEIPEDQIATLFDRKHGSDFSYHIDSDISQSSAHSAPARAKGLSDRNGVSHDDKFKKLGRSISPNQLKTVVDGLTGVGSDHLPIIEVEGVRFREGQSDLVRTSLSVQRTRKEGGLKMKSTIAPAQYVGFRSRGVE
ncbi:hypothetical protein TWF192_010179 [Orbilia oligospora]|nr:hypothetical protein TWF192_010179 [Orbilia oligospora]